MKIQEGRLPTLTLGKIALCIPGLLLMAACFSTKPDDADDFREFYRAATLVHSAAGLYSDSGGHTADTYLPFIRIPSYALILRPLHLFGYHTAHILWTGLTVLAFGAVVWIAKDRRDETALALCYSFPVVFSLILGQDIAFVIPIAMASVRLHSANREFASGTLASLLLSIKVTYFLPVALVFLLRSRRGLLGLTAGTIVQLAVSFVLEGRRWPFQAIALSRSPLLDTELRRMLSVRAPLAVLPAPCGALLSVAAAAALAGWIWFIVRRLRFADAMQVALPLGLIAFPHSYIYDAVVFIPLLASAASLQTWTGRLALFGLTPIPSLLLLSNSPAGVFIGSASLIGAVVFASVDLYRTRGAVSEEWPIRLTPGSVAPLPHTM